MHSGWPGGQRKAMCMCAAWPYQGRIRRSQPRSPCTSRQSCRLIAGLTRTRSTSGRLAARCSSVITAGDREVWPAERARRDHQAGPDEGRRGKRPRAEREPCAQRERRAVDEREQHQHAGAVVAVVAGVLVGQRRVGDGEADQRDDHVGDLDEVVSPTPQPARTRGWRVRGIGHERRPETCSPPSRPCPQRRRGDPETSSPARRICEPLPQ